MNAINGNGKRANKEHFKGRWAKRSTQCCRVLFIFTREKIATASEIKPLYVSMIIENSSFD
jgi:hypothetical protein